MIRMRLLRLLTWSAIRCFYSATAGASCTSTAFSEAFALTPAEVHDRPLFEMGDGEWNIPRLRSLLESEIGTHPTDGVEIVHEFRPDGPQSMMVSARRIGGNAGDKGLIALTIGRTREGPQR